MKQRITDIIKTFGENDGICSRIYVDGNTMVGIFCQLLGVMRMKNLLVFLQDESDRYRY